MEGFEEVLFQIKNRDGEIKILFIGNYTSRIPAIDRYKYNGD